MLQDQARLNGSKRRLLLLAYLFWGVAWQANIPVLGQFTAYWIT